MTPVVRARLSVVAGALLVLLSRPAGTIDVRPTGGQDPEACGRLRARGRLIVCVNGEPFRWRGVTGFRLVHQIATGDEGGARRYLEWASATGFNLIRVLSTATVLFDLPPEDGRAALPRALALARAHGLYVEVIAVNDSAERAYDWRGHSRAVARICAAADNCVFEFANEPGHGVQDVRLHDMAAVDRFAAEAVDGFDMLWTAGPSWDSDLAEVPGGAFVVRHLERAGSPWDMARRLRGFETLSARLARPVVSNEPIGFDELPGSTTGRQRIVDCDVALAFGALSRVLEIGTTFHLQAGLLDETPGREQRRCASDFILGTRLVADSTVLTPQDVIGRDALVAARDPARLAGLYAGVAAGEGLVVAFGLEGDPGIEWRGVSSVRSVVDRHAVKIWLVTVERPGGGGSLWESNPPLPSRTGGDRF